MADYPQFALYLLPQESHNYYSMLREVEASYLNASDYLQQFTNQKYDKDQV